jgi:hypothetical protein
VQQLVAFNSSNELKACARRWNLRVSGNKTTLATRIVSLFGCKPPDITLFVGQHLCPIYDDGHQIVTEVMIYNKSENRYEFATRDSDGRTGSFAYSEFTEYFDTRSNERMNRASQRGPVPKIGLRYGQQVYPNYNNQCVIVVSILNWNERTHRYEFEVAEPDSSEPNSTYPYSEFHAYFTESPPHRNTPAPTPSPPPVAASNSTATAAVTTPSCMSPIDIKLANDAYLLSMPPPILHVGQHIYSKCANKYTYTITRINFIHRDTLCFEYIDIKSQIKDIMYCASFHLHMSIYPHAISPSQLRS